jgi:hypothetical protein
VDQIAGCARARPPMSMVCVLIRASARAPSWVAVVSINPPLPARCPFSNRRPPLPVDARDSKGHSFSTSPNPSFASCSYFIGRGPGRNSGSSRSAAYWCGCSCREATYPITGFASGLLWSSMEGRSTSFVPHGTPKTCAPRCVGVVLPNPMFSI